MKTYLPDKTKDYQLTSSIPELYIPSDLSNSAIRTSPKPVLSKRDVEVDALLAEIKRIETNQQNDIETAPIISVANDTTYEKPVENVYANDIPEDNEPAIYVELVEFSGGATRIRVEQNMEIIWRIVGKSLSRHSVEIINRNELERMYFVQYDASFKKFKDDSLWDEARFIFGADPAQEEEFRIKLVEYGGLIEIIVLNRYEVPISTGNGLKLLNLLYKTIKQDVAR